MPRRPLSLKLYRCLLRRYPAGFRDSYGAPMEQEFRDRLAESAGASGLTLLWFHLLADLAVSLPSELARELTQDLRHAVRLWAARPWHTAFAVAALAIGIGAGTGVFSVINSLLLRSLPFHEPGRLAELTPYEVIPPHDSAEQFHAWVRQSTYLAGAALFEQNDSNLGAEDVAMRAHVSQTSSTFFDTLGTRPVLGRAFAPGEDAEGRASVAVIGYGLWQQLFAGDRRALGATIQVDGQPLTIIGVAPPEFDYPGGSVVWKPAIFRPGNYGWATVFRLKPGLTWPQARAAFDTDVARFSPNRQRTDSPRPQMRSLRDALAGPAKSASLMLMAGVILILLIACTNVANLLMARTADRTAELSIRSALGASRARLIQQLLTECLLLSFVAALAGLLIAWAVTSLAAKAQPPPLAAQSYSILDARVLAFTILASVLCCLFFGILPSLYAGRIRAFGARGSSGSRQSSFLRDALVAAQVMLTLVLLTASISIGRAFVHLMTLDRGYNVDHVVSVNVSLQGTALQTNHAQLAYFEEVLARLRALPGVRSASATEFLPLYANGFVGGPFGVDGQRAKLNSTMVPILSSYFQTMGGRIVDGREFTDAEVRTGARVAIVNQRFAADFGAPRELLGRRLTIGRTPPRLIVGVVQGMDYVTDPTIATARMVFIPSETPGGFSSTFIARVNGSAGDYLANLRDTIRSVYPQVPIFGVRTMQQRLDDLYSRQHFYRTAAWTFAAFAMLLAIIGIYGVVSYAAVQRTREMGVRLALGTTAWRLRAMMLRQGLLTVAVGAALGSAAAAYAGRFLDTLIEGAEPVSLLTGAVAVAVVLAIAAAGIWVATRRIAALDIIAIVRAE